MHELNHGNTKDVLFLLDSRRGRTKIIKSMLFVVTYSKYVLPTLTAFWQSDKNDIVKLGRFDGTPRVVSLITTNGVEIVLNADVKSMNNTWQ